MSDAVQQALDEISRQRRLVDQMATAHSYLRDKYKRRSTIMTCSLLSASVLATGFAFASGDATVSLFGVSALRSTWLGWFAIVTFSATLTDLVVDWRGSARSHEDAVRQLAGLKAEYRTPPSPGTEIDERDRLSQRYQVVMDSICAIPENQFNRLKARHLAKVEVSRILSSRPGMSVRQARRELRQRTRSTPSQPPAP